MKSELDLKLIIQSNDVITAKPGEIPVVPDMIINGSCLEQGDLKRIGINFMRSGCPTIQILFNGNDKEDCTDPTPDVEILKQEWSEFLDIVKLEDENFEFHGLKGKLINGFNGNSPLNMSILITRHVLASKIERIDLS